MKTLNLCSTLVVSCFLLSNLSAQLSFSCGTKEVEEVKRQLLQNREDMRGYIFDRSAITYVPVRFFLVAQTDGSKRPSELLPLRALCFLNTNYTDQNIQFFLREIKHFNNNTVHSNPGSIPAAAAIAGQMIYDAINVFIVGDANGQTAAFYQPPAGKTGADWIVITNTYADDPRVLTHEVGHFFSLPHPFHGWESSGGWDPKIHGNPVGLTAPNGKTPNEFVDASNCKTAGDGICDTPADYLFPSLSCAYTGNAKDPRNEPLKPDIKNYMNYHFSCSSYAFTPDQRTAIANSLFHSTRSYIRTSIAPKLPQVTTSPVLSKPAQNELIPTFNNVTLNWSEVLGAEKYLVEVSNAVAGTLRFSSNTNTLTLKSLSPNIGYWWKVMAYNEHSTCGGFSSNRIFRTGDLVSSSFEEVKKWKWSVEPTAISISGPVFIKTESPELFVANIRLTSLTGQTLQKISNHIFNAGFSSFEIQPGQVPPGVYILSLETEHGIESKRIAILRN